MACLGQDAWPRLSSPTPQNKFYEDKVMYYSLSEWKRNKSPASLCILEISRRLLLVVKVYGRKSTGNPSILGSVQKPFVPRRCPPVPSPGSEGEGSGVFVRCLFFPLSVMSAAHMVWSTTDGNCTFAWGPRGTPGPSWKLPSDLGVADCLVKGFQVWSQGPGT